MAAEGASERVDDLIRARSDALAGRRLRVGVLGAGTVGREVVAALVDGWRAAEFELAGVAVRDMAKAQEAGVPAEFVTDAPAHLVASDADIVVELIGGEEPAHTIIAAALGAGIPVVTANKYVVARYGAELEAISRRTGAALRFEAAVMGGTPILRLLAEDLAGARVTSFRGIVNGTTNYILSQMEATGSSYETALAAAQAAGYAESDPAADVEGGDAADKLVILARLAFGRWLDRASVTVSREGGRPGITGVTTGDLEEAANRGHAIRLLASAARADLQGPIEASVLPTEVPRNSPLGGTTGVRNRIEIEAEHLGWIAVEGPGAGGPATSAAVLADLAAVADGRGSTWGDLPPATAESGLTPESNIPPESNLPAESSHPPESSAPAESSAS